MKRIILLVVLFLFAGVVVGGQTVERKYDRFKDETTLSVLIGDSPMDRSYRSVKWNLTVRFAGERIPTDPEILLLLTTSSRTGILGAGEVPLRSIIDGERILIGNMTSVSLPYSQAVLESASLKISIEILKKLAAAKTVETQTGGLEWKFSTAGLARVKEFLVLFDQN